MVPTIRIIRPSVTLNEHDIAASRNGPHFLHGRLGGPNMPIFEPSTAIEERWRGEGVQNGVSEKWVGDERMKWWKVYAMHLLFMWNSRTFEYVSILLVALAFPEGGLFATSVRGITSTVSTMLFASAVGNWIDRSPSRLPTLLITIFLNHAAIVVSYICWLYWPVIAGYSDEGTVGPQGPFSNMTKGFMYGLILLLDIIHDLSSIANRLSVERDWIPVLVGPVNSEVTYGLTQVNAVMVRLELICKLVAPSLLPLIMASFASRAGWISLLAGITSVLWAAEVYIARLVASENPELQAPKKPSRDQASIEDQEIEERYENLKPGITSWPKKLHFILYQDPAMRLRHFFSIPMWPASIAHSLLELTVLAYSATLITYLMQTGFSISSITVARASGAITGLAGTVLTPWIVNVLKRRHVRAALDDEDSELKGDGGEGKIVRKVGMLGISSQFVCMIPVVFVLWSLSPPIAKKAATMMSRDSNSADTGSPNLILPLTLFTFLSLSRIGHYMIHLMVQELGQVEIPVSQRSTYAGTEQSFHSMGSLCHWAATVVWSQPSDFRWLALGSLLCVGLGVFIFGNWAKKPPTATGDGYQGIPLVDTEDRLVI